VLNRYFIRPTTIDRIHASWIGDAIERYVVWLGEQGYAARNVFVRVPILLRFGQYAQEAGANRWEELPAHVAPFVETRLNRERREYSELQATERRGPPSTKLQWGSTLRSNWLPCSMRAVSQPRGPPPLAFRIWAESPSAVPMRRIFTKPAPSPVQSNRAKHIYQTIPLQIGATCRRYTPERSVRGQRSSVRRGERHRGRCRATPGPANSNSSIGLAFKSRK